MKKLILIFLFVGLLKTSKGQDVGKPYEFGSTLVTVNFQDLNYTPPTYELINGLFFRYTKRRWGFRAFTSYSEKTSSYTNSSWNEPYFWGSTETSKDFKLGIGGQFSLLKNHDWLYSFLDLSYRNVFSTGYDFGYWNETFSKSSNGFDGFAGLGFKIKMMKNFFLSPEFGCYSSTQFVNKTTTYPDLYSITPPHDHVSFKNSYTSTDVYAVFKMHLTVRF